MRHALQERVVITLVRRPLAISMMLKRHHRVYHHATCYGWRRVWDCSSTFSLMSGIAISECEDGIKTFIDEHTKQRSHYNGSIQIWPICRD